MLDKHKAETCLWNMLVKEVYVCETPYCCTASTNRFVPTDQPFILSFSFLHDGFTELGGLAAGQIRSKGRAVRTVKQVV